MIGDNGRKVRILGLEKWDPQVRSAFEFAVTTWVRRIIQQNDHGQMNAMMASPMAKMLMQFRSFTLGAWSKQTLSSIHMRDQEAIVGFLASMMFGAAAYATQSAIQGIGLSGEDAEKFQEDRLTTSKIAEAAFQRAGASSLLPGVIDTGLGAFGATPLFDTRSTQHPSSGLTSNPTFGLIDGIYSGMRSVNKSLLQGDDFTSKDFRGLSRTFNLLNNYPVMAQLVNATSQYLPRD